VHGCTIGNRVLVGIGAIVLDGVVVEDDVMIGGGRRRDARTATRVRRPVRGQPRRRVRELTDAEIARVPAMASWYVALKKDYGRPESAVTQRGKHRRGVRPHAAPEQERLAACSTSMPQPCSARPAPRPFAQATNAVSPLPYAMS